ncbi:hypothetical protein GCM10010462_02260 [Microbacterium dextranolyticum]|uniref:Uncharacterized protein n=1 Tax=Microbacterium dextranolyticum TaxID=36806 RepID=A0A9W6M6L3_9MICO|nr:hypothetical protein GCM10017591_16910 [Microbacterium dextranolyticum]
MRAMRPPGPPRVDAAETDRNGRRGIDCGRRSRSGAQEPPAQNGGFEHESEVALGAVPGDQLRGEDRPRRIRRGAVGVQTRQARRETRDDDRTHLRVVAFEHDRQVHRVTRHETCRASRVDRPVGDDDHGDAGVGFVVRPARHRRLEPGGPPPAGEGVGLGEGDAGGELGSYGERSGRRGDQGCGDLLDEAIGIARAGAEGECQRYEHRVRDAASQRVEESLLPRSDIVDEYRVVDPELQARLRAPEDGA